MSLDEFSRARLGSIDDAMSMAPADLLRLILDGIERGELDPDGILVIWCRRPSEEEAWQVSTARAGLTRDAELVQLEVAKASLMQRWLG